MRGRQRTVNVLTKRQQKLNKETATGQAGLDKTPELEAYSLLRVQNRARIVNVTPMCDATLRYIS
jgi:hypothetical protein